MTEQEKYVRSAGAVFGRCLKILNQRSLKYTGTSEPFANFESAAETADTDPIQGIMTRFGDKLGRIKYGLRALRAGDFNEFPDEPLKDSLEDAINYLAIIYIYLETGGGQLFDDFLESEGMAVEEDSSAKESAEEDNPGWFRKFLG